MTGKAKIAFFEIEEWEKDYVKSKLKNFKITFFSEKIENIELKKIRDTNIVSPFIYSQINRNIINNLPNLKLITTRSTGFDHIDISECKKRKIKVSNVPFYGENTVAEHTFALILALSRKIPQSYDRTIRGDFSLDGLRGFDLKGKTIGVIGTGHIGMHVIRMAKGFEMNVLAFDILKNRKMAKKLGFTYVDFDKLLGASDIVTVHVPLNKHTHHMINKKNVGKMKKGAILINTARGGIVETEALVKAIYTGSLGGAGLDVLEEEDLIKEEIQLLSKKFLKRKLEIGLKNRILLKFDNVIITPHNGFNSKEALQRILDATVENIKSFTKGKPVNTV